MSDSMIEDVRKRIYNLGIQKILDTTNVETKEEARQIVQEIWLATIPMCRDPHNGVELEGLSEQRISDWCAKHRK